MSPDPEDGHDSKVRTFNLIVRVSALFFSISFLLLLWFGSVLLLFAYFQLQMSVLEGDLVLIGIEIAGIVLVARFFHTLERVLQALFLLRYNI